MRRARDRAAAAEAQLEWDPLPTPVPRPLRRLVASADEALAAYVLDRRLDARTDLARAYDRIISAEGFAACGPALQAAVFNRGAVAHNWTGVSQQSTSELTLATRLLDAGLRVAEPDSPEAARLLINRSNTLLNEFHVRGERTDLDDAVAAAQAALRVVGAPAKNAARTVRCLALTNIATVLRTRHRVDGQTEDLDAAIGHARAAVRDGREGPRRVYSRYVLADALLVQVDVTGSLSALDESIELLRTCLASTTLPVQLERTGFAGTLGSALRRRFIRSRSRADIDESIACLQDGFDIERSSPARLTNYGNALMDRFSAFGDVQDLAGAVDVQRAAVRRTPVGDWQQASRYNNAGNAVLAAAERLDDAALLDEAVADYRSSIELTKPGAPERASREYNLGRALLTRWDSGAGDADQIRDAFAAAVEHGLVGSLEWAFSAAEQWGRWASGREAWVEAADAYARAIDVVRRLFRMQLFNSHKEMWLRLSQGLPGEAAYAMVRAGRTEDAVLALESGRALLMSEALDLDRADLDALAAGGRHDLVLAYRRAAQRVQDAIGTTADALAVRDARAVLEEVIDTIRAAGHERFLADLDWSGVIAAVPNGSAISWICTSAHGGTSITVDDGGRVQAIRLPQCTSDTVRRMADLIRAARRGDPRGGAFLGSLDAVGRWSWNAVMGPLLAAVDAAHLFLVPCGLIAELPLHAAWTTAPDGRRRYAIDERVLSYLPSARALSDAAAGVVLDRALVVADPTPSALPSIELAGEQADWAGCAAATTTVLAGPDADHEQVRDAAMTSDLVHFACHGTSRPADPRSSGLTLAHDVELTLGDLAAMRLSGSADNGGGARLVVLSACETDQPGTELPDEVISLPTGLLQAGAAGVVATQWRVYSVPITLLLSRFYVGVLLDARPPADALNDAQRWLRDTTNGEKVHDLDRDIARLRERFDGRPQPRRTLQRMLLLRDPDSRDFADATEWAALTYHGV